MPWFRNSARNFRFAAVPRSRNPLLNVESFPPRTTVSAQSSTRNITVLEVSRPGILKSLLCQSRTETFFYRIPWKQPGDDSRLNYCEWQTTSQQQCFNFYFCKTFSHISFMKTTVLFTFEVLADVLIDRDYYMLRAWYRFYSRVFNTMSRTSNSSSEWAIWY